MSDEKVYTDVILIGICDQLDDEQLLDLTQCAEAGEPVPQTVEVDLTKRALGFLELLLGHEYGRQRVMEAVQLEQHARSGGA